MSKLDELENLLEQVAELQKRIRTLQSDLAKRDEVLRVALKILNNARPKDEYDGSWDEIGDSRHAIQSCLNTTSEGEK